MQRACILQLDLRVRIMPITLIGYQSDKQLVQELNKFYTDLMWRIFTSEINGLRLCIINVITFLISWMLYKWWWNLLAQISLKDIDWRHVQMNPVFFPEVAYSSENTSFLQRGHCSACRKNKISKNIKWFETRSILGDEMF